MDIEIKHRDPFAAAASHQCGDGDGVKVAKSHGPFPSSVMAGRTHQTEGGFSGAGRLQRLQSPSHRPPRMFLDEGISGGIGVEIGGVPNLLDMPRGMGKRNTGFIDGRWPGPCQLQLVLRLERFHGAGDSFRPFRTRGSCGQ